MFSPVNTYFCWSVDNLTQAKAFYHETLGIEIEELTHRLRLHLPGGSTAIVYEKADHYAANYTILDLVVDDIDEAVDELAKRGVVFKQQKNLPVQQDKRQIMRGSQHDMGPDIAWFNDPAGNTLAVLQG